MTERRLDPLLENRMQEHSRWVEELIAEGILQPVLPTSAQEASQAMKYGTLYSVARQVELSTLPSSVNPTTQPGIGIGVGYSLLSELGRVLEELDSLQIILGRYKESLESAYGSEKDGTPGPTVPINSDCVSREKKCGVASCRWCYPNA